MDKVSSEAKSNNEKCMLKVPFSLSKLKSSSYRVGITYVHFDTGTTSYHNKRHAMHAEAMTFHKGSLIIFRTFVKKLGYIKVTDTFCAE